MKYIVAVLTALVIGLSVYVYLGVPKTAHVNIDDLYNSFPLKVELEKKLKATEKERQIILDSLKIEVTVLSKKLSAGGKKNNPQDISLFEAKREYYFQKEEQFKEDIEAQTQEYKSQIWKQLHQYINNYGKAKGYDYIYGVDEGYSFLYGNESKNITSALKKYLEEQYKGIQ